MLLHEGKRRVADNTRFVAGRIARVAQIEQRRLQSVPLGAEQQPVDRRRPAGLVVILPAAMEANFGDGALYGDPADVARMIDDLWADPQAYAAQSARAVRTVQERFGEAALLARVEQYLG